MRKISMEDQWAQPFAQYFKKFITIAVLIRTATFFVFAPNSLPKIIISKTLSSLYFLTTKGLVIFQPVFSMCCSIPLFMRVEGKGSLYRLDKKNEDKPIGLSSVFGAGDGNRTHITSLEGWNSSH